MVKHTPTIRRQFVKFMIHLFMIISQSHLRFVHYIGHYLIFSLYILFLISTLTYKELKRKETCPSLYMFYQLLYLWLKHNLFSYLMEKLLHNLYMISNGLQGKLACNGIMPLSLTQILIIYIFRTISSDLNKDSKELVRGNLSHKTSFLLYRSPWCILWFFLFEDRLFHFCDVYVFVKSANFKICDVVIYTAALWLLTLNPR